MQESNLFFIASFYNVILCFTKFTKTSTVYLLHDPKSRKHNRNLHLFVQIAYQFLRNNKINVYVIDPISIRNTIIKSNSKNIYLEMGSFHHCFDLQTDNSVSGGPSYNFIAINSGVDLLLATASYRKSIFNLRKLLSIYRWKKGVNKLLFNDSWLMSEISKNNFTVGGKKVNQVTANDIYFATMKLFKLPKIKKLLKVTKSSKDKILVLGLGCELTPLYLSNLAKEFEIVTMQKKIPYIVKPHPNISFNQKILKQIEKVIGYSSLNKRDKNNLELIRVVPLEIILSYYINSEYIGVYTGSVNFIGSKRTHWVLTGDKKMDKVLKIYYSEFVKYLSRD